MGSASVGQRAFYGCFLLISLFLMALSKCFYINLFTLVLCITVVWLLAEGSYGVGLSSWNEPNRIERSWGKMEWNEWIHVCVRLWQTSSGPLFSEMHSTSQRSSMCLWHIIRKYLCAYFFKHLPWHQNHHSNWTWNALADPMNMYLLNDRKYMYR